MKIVTILSLLLFASSAYGELTKEDLRTVIKEEVTASEKRMKEYIDLKIETVNAKIDSVEKSLNARIDAVNARIDATNTKIDAVHTRIDALEKSIDGRFDALNMRMDDVDSRFNRIWLAIIALITAAIALPQLIILYSERKRGREIERLVQQLHEKNVPPPSSS